MSEHAEKAGRLDAVRVLVTRPRERAEALCFLLEDEGAQVMELPLLELLPPENPRPLTAAAEQVSQYPWVVFASPSAVQALVDACREAATLPDLMQRKVGVVGPATAASARAHGLTVTLESEVPSGLGLLDALLHVVSPGTSLLLPAAQDGRSELAAGLLAHGAAVTRVAAYRSHPTERSTAELAELQQHPPQVVLLGSPRTVDALLEVLGTEANDVLGRARMVAIGPTTAQALEAKGWPAAAVAEHPTAAGLVEAAVQAMARNG